jgi:drug/metabolite transporter (DMT)-like permease
MKRTPPALWSAGWAGLAIGGVLVVIGISQPGELGSVVAGYGWMLAGSAVYLLAGLTIRQRLGRRMRPIATSSASVSAGRS